MVKEINTSIEIDAPTTAVWQVFIDFSRYSQWNPFIRSITGKPNQGEQLEVFIQPPGGSGMKFRPVILNLQPERELRWRGRLLLPGVFDGEHQFQLEPIGENRTRFIHSEVFAGLLVPFLWRDLDTKVRQGFEEMNQALKNVVEQNERVA
ncbi:SRPBCC family protein [Egbenema bharatensis]|uniref:SRPBCC family protein n=1 Tax=Egbenema bharatensis TaxID=3463334 RepID=UPI003A83EF8C